MLIFFWRSPRIDAGYFVNFIAADSIPAAALILMVASIDEVISILANEVLAGHEIVMLEFLLFFSLLQPVAAKQIAATVMIR